MATVIVVVTIGAILGLIDGIISNSKSMRKYRKRKGNGLIVSLLVLPAAIIDGVCSSSKHKGRRK